MQTYNALINTGKSMDEWRPVVLASEAKAIQAATRQLVGLYSDTIRELLDEIKGIKEERDTLRAELAAARERITLLSELVDGAENIIAVFEPASQAQAEFKFRWLRTAQAALNGGSHEVLP